MSKFYSLALILAFFTICSSAIAEPIVSVNIHQEYVFKGELSSDISAVPVLKTFSTTGIPIEIQLNLPDKIQLKTIALRGKGVKAKVLIESRKASRVFTGHLQSIELYTEKLFKKDFESASH